NYRVISADELRRALLGLALLRQRAEKALPRTLSAPTGAEHHLSVVALLCLAVRCLRSCLRLALLTRSAGAATLVARFSRCAFPALATLLRPLLDQRPKLAELRRSHDPDSLFHRLRVNDD